MTESDSSKSLEAGARGFGPPNIVFLVLRYSIVSTYEIEVKIEPALLVLYHKYNIFISWSNFECKISISTRWSRRISSFKCAAAATAEFDSPVACFLLQ